ncbi:MAG: gas vesicle protein GvpO [Atribacterota bacterium]
MAKELGILIEKARKDLSKLTGLTVSSTTGATKDEKGWHISIELVEKHSIPDQMDILALYEVLFDEEGNLLSFERKSMRKRMQAEVAE